MTARNKKNTARTLPGILLTGLAAGMLPGLVDLYLGISFSHLSSETYLFFFAAYILSGILGALTIFIINVLSLGIFKKTLSVYGLYFLCMVGLYQFFILNLKLTGWIQINNLRSIVVNGSFLLNLFLLILFHYRNNWMRKAGHSRWFLFTGFALTVGLTAYFQFYLMNWLSPPESKAITLLLLFSILAIPWAVTGMFAILNICLGRFSAWKQRWIQVACAGIILIGIPAVFHYPDLSEYDSSDTLVSGEQKKNSMPNVIWIVMDTVRRDRMSCYGHKRSTTPNIDSLVKEDGVLFTNYISTAPWTLPSHSSMFTGLYSSSHGAVQSDTSQNPSIPLALSHQTLAELLLENGYETRAYVANFVVLRPHNQLNQGFQFYLSQPNYFDFTFWGVVLNNVRFYDKSLIISSLRLNLYKLSSEINRLAFHWLGKKHERPFFLFINYMESHSGSNYLPRPFFNLYGFSWDKYIHDLPLSMDIQKIVTYEREITGQEQQILFDLVDCKVTYLDTQIGQLIEKLKQLNLFDNSLIILVSDHGTMLGEHHTFGHNTDLYEQNIHVPLIIKYPQSQRESKQCDKTIQTVDLMPEVLSVLHIPIPEQVQGQPISEVNHTIVSELFACKKVPMAMLNPERYDRSLRALYNRKQYKYIQASNNLSELYYLANDPGENSNLFYKRIDISDKMDRRIDAWYRNIPVFQPKIKSQKLDPRLKKSLKALGYIQ